MNLQKMMQQAQAMQQKMANVQQQLEAMEFDGAAGGGMVKIRINGKHMMLSVGIDDSLMKADEKDVLEDLLVAAYNDARAKADDAAAGEMKNVTSGLNLPPGFKLPF